MAQLGQTQPVTGGTYQLRSSPGWSKWGQAEDVSLKYGTRAGVKSLLGKEKEGKGGLSGERALGSNRKLLNTCRKESGVMMETS